MSAPGITNLLELNEKENSNSKSLVRVNVEIVSYASKSSKVPDLVIASGNVLLKDLAWGPGADTKNTKAVDLDVEY